MDNILFSIGTATVFKNAAVITLGVILCSLLTLMLYKRRTGTAAAVVVMLPIAYILSMLLSRFLHWYFTGYAYTSFKEAFTNFSVGSFALAGVILGIWLAAAIVRRAGLCESTGLLLDCTCPGFCLLVAFIRLSCYYTSTCIGNINITTRLFQWAPLAIAITDNAGNTDYRLRVYFMEAVLMLALAAVTLLWLKRLEDVPMQKPCSRHGNTARRFLVLFACIEIVMDSLRNDSILMRFRFLHQLNPYSSFISLAQVFSLALLLYVFIYYLVCAAKIYGFGKRHIKAIVLFLLCAVLMGGTGEFCIQRFGMVRLLLTVRTWGYLSMLIGCAGMVWNITGLYRDCTEEP